MSPYRRKGIKVYHNRRFRHHYKRLIGNCSYHICNKRTELYRCKYCRGLFCNEHLKAKPPSLPSFVHSNLPKWLKDEVDKEWENRNGHPCATYFDIWKNWKEREKSKFYRPLITKGREYTIPPIVEHPPDESKQEISHQVENNQKPSEYTNPRPKRNFKYIIFGISILTIILVSFYFGNNIISFVTPLNCSDGTIYNFCSPNKPYYCFNGTLLKRSNVCGCPSDYKVEGEDCKKIQRCFEGTIYGECSPEKPLYCSNGSLVKKASICGCPSNEVSQGELCISIYEVRPVDRALSYTVRGNTQNINIVVYGGLNDYLASLSRSYYCDPTCPSDTELELKYLDNIEQKGYLEKLADKIKSLTDNKDNQARIAISTVQKIPYDWEGFNSNDLNNRYPYEVLYDDKGVCGEKSHLLAFLLRDFGFGVVLFNYETQQHMAVGIKCPMQYSYQNSGYCFVEAAAPTITTDSEGDYVGVGKLQSTPEIIKVSDGISFDSVSEEYNDYQEFVRLNKISESSGGYLSAYDYSKWLALVQKYGIEVSK